jgi:hypothetical protein
MNDVTKYSAFGKSLCTQAMVRRFGCQYWICRWNGLLFHYSVVKQRLKCNTGKVLIQFLLTVVRSIEECVFLVEYIFWEGNRYTDLVQEKFSEKFPETPVPHRSVVCRLIEKFHQTGCVRHQHSWTSLPTPFVSGQQLSESSLVLFSVTLTQDYPH